MTQTPRPASAPSRRTVGLGALGAAAATGLTACGGGSGGDDSGPARLRFTWWGSDARHEYTQEIIKQFNEENPDIFVEGEFTEWSGYWDRLATSTAANDSPDIIQMDAAYLKSYADRGALLDLSKEDGLDTGAISDDDLALGESDGGLYAIVQGVVPHAIVANAQILEAAGVPVPDDTTWTWEEYARIGKAVSDAGLPDVYGIQTEGVQGPPMENWAMQLGETLFTDEGGVGLNPDTLASFWEYHLGLAESGAGTPVTLTIERNPTSSALDQSGTATNTVAFAPWWSTQLTALTNASGQRLLLLRPPAQSPGGDPGLYYKASMYWAVSSRTEHPEAAVRFINHLSTADAVADLMLTERGIPANPAFRERIVDKLAETDRMALEYVNSIEDVVNPAPPIPPVGGSSSGEIMTRIGSDVLFGRQTPDAAAQAFVDDLTNQIESA
ncbi:ABC transporter substrate-binding protein [Kineococcus esterisolvens]|uniref:ABC transporter substrate-binding protein n=1 Tax=unclassified Kineococcus TaxID=2621656 RepID=UPI003D7CB0B9